MTARDVWPGCQLQPLPPMLRPPSRLPTVVLFRNGHPEMYPHSNPRTQDGLKKWLREQFEKERGIFATELGSSRRAVDAQLVATLHRFFHDGITTRAGRDADAHSQIAHAERLARRFLTDGAGADAES